MYGGTEKSHEMPGQWCKHSDIRMEPCFLKDGYKLNNIQNEKERLEQNSSGRDEIFKNS
jgi:hypothetical protein